jgi:hypothetical protein
MKTSFVIVALVLALACKFLAPQLCGCASTTPQQTLIGDAYHHISVLWALQSLNSSCCQVFGCSAIQRRLHQRTSVKQLTASQLLVHRKGICVSTAFWLLLCLASGDRSLMVPSALLLLLSYHHFHHQAWQPLSQPGVTPPLRSQRPPLAAGTPPLLVP